MNEDFQRGPGDKVTFLINSIIIIKCDSEKSDCGIIACIHNG